jgi:SAM-dependent methyltransferase
VSPSILQPSSTPASRAWRGWRASAAVLLLSGVLFTGSASAAELSVPYVPTPQEVVERMLEVAKVGPEDYVIDLGSGDGRIVITAARKFGARGFGVDLNPARVAEAQENARKARVADRVTFQQGDLFEADLSQATVITMYLLPQVNLELRPKLLTLRPGVRLVSHDFSMGEWKPDHHERVYAKDRYGGASEVFLWIVPARLAGAWRWQLTVRGKPVEYELTLEQAFQAVSGTARVGAATVRLEDVTLSGAQLSFGFTAEVAGEPVKHRYTGKVADGSFIDGIAELSGPRLRATQEWSARRSAGAAAVEGAR